VNIVATNTDYLFRHTYAQNARFMVGHGCVDFALASAIIEHFGGQVDKAQTIQSQAVSRDVGSALRQIPGCQLSSPRQRFPGIGSRRGADVT
jgi:hypothetical protein